MATTYKAAAIEEMLSADPSGRLRQLHDCLVKLGLKTRMPSNSGTLLFEAVNAKKERIGLVAIRSGHTEVLSFPKPYWIRHAQELYAALASIEDFQHVETEGVFSSSQYSLKQIRISRDTLEKLDSIITNVIGSHARKLAHAA